MIFKRKNFQELLKKDGLGIGDKYWITSLIPPSGKEFKTTFDYKKNLEQILLQLDPLELKENRIEEELQVIVAAKRVDVIDGYAETLKH